MVHPLLDMRGLWEEIAPQMNAMKGQRVRVIVLPNDEASELCGDAATPLDTALHEIWSEVPDTSWDQFPSDFANHIDHYLYGTPKRA